MAKVLKAEQIREEVLVLVVDYKLKDANIDRSLCDKASEYSQTFFPQ